MITKKQFDILEHLAYASEPCSQRDLQEKTGFSLGTINKIVKDFVENGLIENNQLTPKGFDTLEPFKVKNAIIIADRFDARLIPATLNVPTPFIQIKGKRVIDSMIDSLLAVGIDKIFVVRGYLAEQLHSLKFRYPQVELVDNPLYNETNSLTALIPVLEYLSNAYIVEGDIFVQNSNFFRKYQYRTNNIAFRVEKTDAPCFMEKYGLITEKRVGGSQCFERVGISYINTEDGFKLSQDIKETLEIPGGKERIWDDVLINPQKYEIEINECTKDDFIKISKLKILQTLDPTYRIS